MRTALNQPMRIRGVHCTLISMGQTYVVQTCTGRIVGRAMTRLLAVARAAVSLHREGVA